MRVLHVLDTIDPSGAGPVEVARLYSAVRVPDYHPEILTLDAECAGDPWAVPVYAMGRYPLLHRYSKRLVPWLRENGRRYDAVVVHCVFGYHLVGVWRALPQEVPYFLMLHGSLNLWFRKAYPIKHIKKTLFWHLAIGKAAAGARAVFYLCPEEKRVADQAFPIRSRREAFVPLGTLPHAASPEPFLKRFPHLRGKRLLLFLGRICYTKGCDMLLDAFASAVPVAPDAHLIMCGSDQEQLQRSLMSRAEYLGISDRVTWTGPIFGEDRWPVFAAANLLVLPSRCEAFPMVVLEALGCGTPVLLTRVAHMSTEIEEAGAGLACEPTARAIGDALRSWLSQTEEGRSATARRATNYHAEKFGLARAMQMHIEAIREHLPGETRKSIGAVRVTA